MTLREQLAAVYRVVQAKTAAGEPVSREILAQIAELEALQESNPLAFFEPHPARDGHRPQMEFLMADTPVVAAFAGNQFGKSTVLTVSALRECLPADLLPSWLRSSKRFSGPVHGWILVPTEDKVYDSFQPAFEDWCPPAALAGGSWGKGFNGQRMRLSFKNGSSIHFKTYKQDASTLGGARLHWVGYDEPPPRRHREESRMRLVRYGGFEMFAMTPLEANTGYVRREIWKQRESPDITVVRGSIHDNPTLSAQTVQLVLGGLSDLWRRAREYGDFVDVGGLIYPEFERCVAPEPLELDFVRSLDIVVGIDPGIRNAGFAWVGFDRDLKAHVFNEGLLQDTEVGGYAEFIRSENARLGLTDVSYVVDPAARERGKVNATTVMTALAQHEIFANFGQNDHETGFSQMRERMAHGRLVVDPRCLGLRDEADDYAAKEPGEFDDDSHLKPVSSQFHRLDALRYAVMERFWDPVLEQQAPQRALGYRPGTAPPMDLYESSMDAGPMGLFS